MGERSRLNGLFGYVVVSHFGDREEKKDNFFFLFHGARLYLMWFGRGGKKRKLFSEEEGVCR